MSKKSKTKKKWIVVRAGELEAVFGKNAEEDAYDYMEDRRQQAIEDVLEEWGEDLDDVDDNRVAEAAFEAGQDGLYEAFKVEFDPDNDEQVTLPNGDVISVAEILDK